jgi:TonB family protein
MSTTFVLLALSVVLSAQNEKKPPEMNPDENLRVVKAVAPIFPQTAIATGSGGRVVVEVTVNGKGIVTSAKAVEGHPLLRRSAESAGKRWQFASVASGKNIILLTFVFTILPKDASADESASVFTLPFQVEIKNRPYEPIIHSDPRMDRSNK